MGIVKQQSLKNMIVTYLGFGIGAINTMFLYTNIKLIPTEYYGLVLYILSSAAILMPFLALGIHNAIIKFYPTFKSVKDTNSFLTLMLFTPLVSSVLIGLLGCVFYQSVSGYLASKNNIVKDYIWLIFIVAISLAYFEVFYAWTKIKLKSVFGNVMKEVFPRLCVMLLFLLIYINWITFYQFVYAVVIVYVLRMLIMMSYAFKVKKLIFSFKLFPNVSSILKYSLLIVLAGSIASVIFEIDKLMINQYLVIDNIAFYSVAIFIATTIGVPARAMHQITNPLTAQLLSVKDKKGLGILYKKSSLNLFIIGSLVFLTVVINIKQLYLILPIKYSGGVLIVFLVGIAKLFDNVLGNNNAILFNSNYYRVVLVFGVIMALVAVVLNRVLIPLYGINGAAVATFISIICYNLSKVLFVYFKFKITPFSYNTLYVFVLLVTCFGLFYFWDFKINPFVNIAFKTSAFGLVYVFCVYKFKLSNDVNMMVTNWLKK